MPTFEFTVDGDPFTTTEHTLTPTQILEIARISPTNHFLEEKQGDHLVSFETTPTIPIHMHEHMKFISELTGQTTVS